METCNEGPNIDWWVRARLLPGGHLIWVTGVMQQRQSIWLQTGHDKPWGWEELGTFRGLSDKAVESPNNPEDRNHTCSVHHCVSSFIHVVPAAHSNPSTRFIEFLMNEWTCRSTIQGIIMSTGIGWMKATTLLPEADLIIWNCSSDRLQFLVTLGDLHPPFLNLNCWRGIWTDLALQTVCTERSGTGM